MPLTRFGTSRFVCATTPLEGDEALTLLLFWVVPQVPIPKRSQVKERRFGLSRGFGGLSESSTRCTIEQCLDAFCAKEILEDSEAAYCKKCKTHRPASKQMHVYRCPPVLVRTSHHVGEARCPWVDRMSPHQVIHIKRFLYTMFRRDKLTTGIQFPTESLNMAPYCADTCAL